MRSQNTKPSQSGDVSPRGLKHEQVVDIAIVVILLTAYTPEIARQCSGCDLLVHEGGFNDERAYFRASHTNAEELARVAMEARPKQLVLYHQRDVNEEGVRIIRSKFSGPVIVAADLQMFE